MVFWSTTFKTFKWPPLSQSIISEIIRLGYSSFSSKCSKLHAYCRNAIKNQQKVFHFWDNGVWTCFAKLCTLQREYLLWAVNVLTNSVVISDQTNADFFQLNISQMHAKKRIIVVPCWFQRCLEPVNLLISALSSEARPFRRVSNHLFRSP